jgi:transposase-like protein
MDVMAQKQPELITALCPHCHTLETVQVFDEGGKLRFVCMACQRQWEDRRQRPRPGTVRPRGQ